MDDNFQLRGKTYSEKEVCMIVLNDVKKNQTEFNSKYKPIQRDPKIETMYGKEYYDQIDTQNKQNIIRDLLNRSFTQTIKGGSNNYPISKLPNTLDTLTSDHCIQMLHTIRMNRVHTVHRNYSQSKKK